MTTVPLFLRGLAVSALVLAMALDLQEETDFNNLVEPSDDDLLQVSLVQLDLQMRPVSGAGAHGPESEKVVISANGEVASAAAQHGAAGEQGDGKLTNLLQVKRDSESDGDMKSFHLRGLSSLPRNSFLKSASHPKRHARMLMGSLKFCRSTSMQTRTKLRRLVWFRVPLAFLSGCMVPQDFREALSSLIKIKTKNFLWMS